MGCLQPWAELLGPAAELSDLSALASCLQPLRIESREALLRFLRDYFSRTLVQQDLPVICRAHGHACRNEARELIELDQSISGERQPFATASQAAGRAQLNRLKPMRDQRMIHRYLLAVEEGKAKAWHAVVYGAALALYSIPLRQGLAHYLQQTLRGFILAASSRLNLSEAEREALFQQAAPNILESIEQLFPAPFAASVA